MSYLKFNQIWLINVMDGYQVTYLTKLKKKKPGDLWYTLLSYA